MNTEHLNSKKHCWNCAYRKEIPGDAHFACIRSFTDVKPPEQDPYGVRGGWCMFPINFDPTWLGKCDGFSEMKDESKVQSEFAGMASFLFSHMIRR